MMMRKRWLWWTCGSGLLVLLGAVGVERSYPDLVVGLSSLNGVAAKLACSGVFVSDRSLADVVENDLVPLAPMTGRASYDISRADRTVAVSIVGLARQTALYRPGVGCTLLNDTDRETLLRQAEGISETARVPRGELWPAGDQVDTATLPAGVNRDALNRAVAQAFEGDSPANNIDTRAMIVVYGGRVVAESYAPGYTSKTRFLGWSVSKSIAATLVGTLVVDGRLSLDEPAPVPEWQRPGDARRAITLDQLLRMSSGLSFLETYEPASDSTTMLFQRGDMAAYAVAQPLAHPPGTVAHYSSGTTNLLSRIVWQTVGGSLAAYHDYVRQRLFEPAGMRSMVFEPDAAGVFVGSSYVYATARDWARFGLLYLNRGAINGRRILSTEWVDYVRQPSPADAGNFFGAHFWLNLPPDAGSAQREYPDLPADTYMALGHNGQVIAIIPSRNAVIVRLGWTTNGAHFDVNAHFSDVLEALDPPAR